MEATHVVWIALGAILAVVVIVALVVKSPLRVRGEKSGEDVRVEVDVNQAR